MTKLEVFKAFENNFISINQMNSAIRHFIKDVKVVSTDTFKVGAYIFIYVWHEE